jgi:DNA-binding CsgD family transcriptional regulator
MEGNSDIAIISEQWLLFAGLKNVINEINPLANIYYFDNPESYLQTVIPFHVVFSFISYPGIKSKIINPIYTEIEIRSELYSLLKSEKLKETHSSSNSNSSPSLSKRETEVLKLLVQGFINKEIADKMGISLHTVISHRKKITAKLGIKTVSGLTIYALMSGLISH